MRRLACLVVACSVLGACAGKSARTPTEWAITRSNRHVHDSIRAGVRTTSAEGPFEVPVRHNPADCACPPYEVFAYGRWIRAFIDADPRTRELLERLRDGDSLATVRLRGDLAADLRASESRVRYPVFETR